MISCLLPCFRKVIQSLLDVQEVAISKPQDEFVTELRRSWKVPVENSLFAHVGKPDGKIFDRFFGVLFNVRPFSEFSIALHVCPFLLVGVPDVV